MTFTASRPSNGIQPTREDEISEAAFNNEFSALTTFLPHSNLLKYPTSCKNLSIYCINLAKSMSIIANILMSVRSLRQFTMRWEGMAIEELKSIASEYKDEKKGYDLLFSVSRRCSYHQQFNRMLIGLL